MRRAPLSMHRSLIVLSTSALVAGGLAAAAAPAGAATKKAKLPVVTAVSPMSLTVGQPLTLRGTALTAGKARTTVVFQRAGGKAVFARATSGTSKRITVTVPTALAAQLPLAGGVATPARFQLRVLTKRFSKGFTAPKISPLIGPAATGPVAPPALAPAVAAPVGAAPAAPGPATPAPAAAAPDATTTEPAATTPTGTQTTPATTPTPATPVCDPTDPSGDADRDGLANGLERTIKTNPCAADTDGDSVGDYFEQRSALDLNATALPYPGKRPFPNALDPNDANVDYDGDGLTLSEENEAWKKTGSPKVLTYSDGNQFTGGLLRVGATAGEDYDGNGVLSDDEKDVDADGIGNWEEQHGGGQPAWWEAVYVQETPYAGRSFLGLDFLDRDSDGDGLPDGQDDEDHDGFTNAQELIRPDDWETTYVSTTHSGTDPRARVNPFNPCKPFFSSKCHTHPPIGAYKPGEDWASPIHADGP